MNERLHVIAFVWVPGHRAELELRRRRKLTLDAILIPNLHGIEDSLQDDPLIDMPAECFRLSVKSKPVGAALTPRPIRRYFSQFSGSRVCNLCSHVTFPICH